MNCSSLLRCGNGVYNEKVRMADGQERLYFYASLSSLSLIMGYGSFWYFMNRNPRNRLLRLIKILQTNRQSKHC